MFPIESIPYLYTFVKRGFMITEENGFVIDNISFKSSLMRLIY